MKQLLDRLTMGAVTIVLALSLGGCSQSKPAGGTKDNATELAISNRLVAITAAGDPVTLESLDQQYITPSADQNAAPLYEQAFADIKNHDVKSATFVADNIQAVPLLEKAANRTSCRYPIVLTDGYATRLPHLSKVKEAATLLELVAVNQTAKKRLDAAVTTLEAGLSLAHSLDNEPTTLSKLVEIASLKLTLDGLAQSISLQAFSDAQLQSLQTAVKPFETGISFRQAMVCERAFIISAAQMPGAELAQAGIELGGTNGAVNWADYRKTEKFQQDYAFALDVMAKLVAMADMPYAELLANLPDAGSQRKTAAAQGFIFSPVVLPDMGGCITNSADAAARVRAAQVALAVERYRLKHAKALPGALTDLVPEFMAAIPMDPFDEQPLRFKRLPGKGYVIYSIGKNKVDDGGVEKTPDGKTQLDATFAVRR